MRTSHARKHPRGVFSAGVHDLLLNLLKKVPTFLLGQSKLQTLYVCVEAVFPPPTKIAFYFQTAHCRTYAFADGKIRFSPPSHQAHFKSKRPWWSIFWTTTDENGRFCTWSVIFWTTTDAWAGRRGPTAVPGSGHLTPAPSEPCDLRYNGSYRPA